MRVPRLVARPPRSPVAAPLVASSMSTPVAEPPGGAAAGADDETTYTFSRHAIRSNYMDKSIEAKKKVKGRLCFVV